MATSLNTNNLNTKSYANASSNNNMTASTTTKFTAADFQRWNQTTSVVHIPSRLVKTSKILQLRKELINAIGERNVVAVQALSPIKSNIQFKRSSDRHVAEINNISFRDAHLTPLPVYEEVKSVFVEKAPLHMQDNYLYEALAPYGWLIAIQHLTIKGFPSVRSGTRRVSIVVTKAIPHTINVGRFSAMLIVFPYHLLESLIPSLFPVRLSLVNHLNQGSLLLVVLLSHVRFNQRVVLYNRLLHVSLRYR